MASFADAEAISATSVRTYRGVGCPTILEQSSPLGVGLRQCQSHKVQTTAEHLVITNQVRLLVFALLLHLLDGRHGAAPRYVSPPEDLRYLGSFIMHMNHIDSLAVLPQLQIALLVVTCSIGRPPSACCLNGLARSIGGSNIRDVFVLQRTGGAT